MEWMNYEGKSTVKDIRKRFDADVERFSNLETGQSATIDVVLAMDLVTRADPPGAGYRLRPAARSKPIVLTCTARKSGEKRHE